MQGNSKSVCERAWGAFYGACLAASLCLTACAPTHPPRPPEGFSSYGPGEGRDPVDLLADSVWWEANTRRDVNSLEQRQVSWYRVNHRNPPLAETVEIFEDETTEKDLRIRVDAFAPDGSRWSADPIRFTRARARIDGYFTSNQFRHAARIPGYREGMLIRVEAHRTIVRPEFRGGEPLRGAFACRTRFASFRAPEGTAYSAGVVNPEGLPLRMEGDSGPGWREIRVTADGLAPMPALGQPAPEGGYSALRFSVPPQGPRSWDWSRLGDHYLGMIGKDAEGDAQVRKAASGLTGGDPESLARSAFRLVQSRVRYLADEERMNAYVPRAPGRVLANGYGDCKEMANLMRALLAARGVAADLALSQPADAAPLSNAYPSLADFNHMVLSLAQPDGSRLWFDPTVGAAGPPESYLPLLARETLLLRPGGSAPDSVRPAPGYRNRAVTVSRLGPERGGHWILRGEIGLKGKAAFDLNQELRFRHPGPAEARAAVRAFLARSFGIQASEWEWSSPSPDSARIAYAMPADAMLVTLATGGIKLDAPTLMGLGSGLRDAGPEAGRSLPAFEQEDLWILPPGYRQWETRGFAREGATGEWQSSDGGARRAFRCTARTWKAGDQAGLDGFLDALTGFTLASVWQ